MESAIPKHLQCPRSRARRTADDYKPSYPAWVARHPESVKQVVMAYFGIQSRDQDRASNVRGKALPGGHYLPEESPQVLLEELEKFLS